MSYSSQNSIFRQQQNLYRSSHFMSKPKQPTFYSPPAQSAHSTKGRKRRASEDEEMTIADVLVDLPSSSSPSSFNSVTTAATIIDRRNMESSRFTKRNRATVQKQFPISKLLATLEKDKLVELINDLVDANPHLQPEIDAHVPAPTTQSVSALISHLETKLNDSYPPNRPGKNRDDYSFHRVKPYLMDVVNSLIEYADYFTTGNEHPTTIFSYLHSATCTAHRLPTWDNDANNQIKRDLYRELVQRWLKAVDLAAAELERGKIFGHQVVTEWAKEIVFHGTETHELFGPVKQRFTERLGWVIGMDT